MCARVFQQWQRSHTKLRVQYAATSMSCGVHVQLNNCLCDTRSVCVCNDQPRQSFWTECRHQYEFTPCITVGHIDVPSYRLLQARAAW